MSISKGIPNETKKDMANLKAERELEREQIVISIQQEALKVANDPKLTAEWGMNSINKIERLLIDLAKLEQTVSILSLYSKPNE